MFLSDDRNRADMQRVASVRNRLCVRLKGVLGWKRKKGRLNELHQATVLHESRRSGRDFVDGSAYASQKIMNRRHRLVLRRILQLLNNPTADHDRIRH